MGLGEAGAQLQVVAIEGEVVVGRCLIVRGTTGWEKAVFGRESFMEGRREVGWLIAGIFEIAAACEVELGASDIRRVVGNSQEWGCDRPRGVKGSFLLGCCKGE